MINNNGKASKSAYPPKPDSIRIKFDSIPSEIKNVSRWVVWRYECRSDIKGEWKWTKVPYQACSPPPDPYDGVEESWPRAKTDDPATWYPYDDAIATYLEELGWDGIGFMLGDDWSGLDADKCRDRATGEVEAWALDIVHEINSYTEFSPSGVGLKILVLGKKPEGRCRKDRLEMYSRGRFFTITGNHCDGTPDSVESRSNELLKLHTRIFPQETPTARKEPSYSSNGYARPDVQLTATDDRILAKARDAVNGERFAALYDRGETNGAASEADLALCNMLDFWAGHDEVAIDRLFRGSALYRSKWDEQRGEKTYGELTVTKAHARRGDCYDWTKDIDVDVDVNDICKEAKAGCVTQVQQDKSAVLLYKDKPFDNAKEFLRTAYTQEEASILAHWQGVFYKWDGTHYIEMGEDEMRAVAWRFSSEAMTKTKKGVVVGFNPQPTHINALLDALKGIVQLPKSLSPPAWISSSTARQFVPLRNGLLDLDSSELHPHSPSYFCLNCLPHSYDCKAICPTWDDFLMQAFEGDEERADALHEWFAYNLLGSTRQQKIAMLYGVPRSGKGTVAYVLTSLVGEENATAPTLHDLSSRFGLEPILGKMSAIIGDAHMSRKDDAVAILERLKSISGEDRQTIDRKGRKALDDYIRARFTILTNKIPYMPDSSSAIVQRILLIPFEKSFKGKEDTTLKDKLLPEMPGILNRCLEAMVRFRSRGRLLQPAAGKRYLETMVRYCSTIEGFVQDACVVGSGRVKKEDLRSAWQLWCADNGIHVSSDQQFGIDLLAAYPKITDFRKQDKKLGVSTWLYEGIDLNPAWHARIASERVIWAK